MVMNNFTGPEQRAIDHHECIVTLLSEYNTDPAQILFVVAYNASVNKSLANMLGKLMIGCAAHWLNLTMKRQLGWGMKNIDHLNADEKRQSYFQEG